VSRRNTPPAVRVEYLTDTLAVAWEHYLACPSDRARRTMSLVATERMKAQLMPAEEMPATRRAIELRTALAAALLEDNPDPIGQGGWE
jgi:hypothetical protein